MDRRSAVEQQYRSSGTVVGGKKRRVGVRLKRSTTVSEGKFASSHLVSGEEQQPSGAIKSLAYEIDTVAQEQEEVLGLLRRKSGLFRGLGGRFKSVIRGTGGEHHHLKELKQQLNWLRQKEAQLREEKLLLLIKDVSEQPGLQTPGAVAAAVASASAASATETSVKKTPMRSSKRFGFRRASSSVGLGRSSAGTKAASGEETANDNANDKENKDVSAESRARQALSRRHSMGRDAFLPPGGAGHERRHSRGSGSLGAWSSHSGLDALEADGGGGGNSSGTGGVTAPGNVSGVHISSFNRTHLISGGGETYLGANDGRPPLPFQSSGGVPISGSIWRRPMVPTARSAPSAEFQSEAGGNTCTVEEVVAAAAAAAAAAVEADTGSSSPYASSGGWKPEPSPQLDTSQDTAGDSVGWPAALAMSPGVRSEMSSPARLMRARVGTADWEQELQDKARVVMRRHVVVDRKQIPTVSHIRKNSGNWASVTGSTSVRAQQPAASTAAGAAVAAVAAPSSPPSHANPDADAGGGGLGPADGVHQAAKAGFATQPELMLASPTVPKSTTVAAATAAAAQATPSPTTTPVAAPGGSKKVLAAAKTALLRGPLSSSFEPPCEIERLVPAAERCRPSPTPPVAAGEWHHLESSDDGSSTSATSEAETLEDVVERDFVQAAAVAAAEARGTAGGAGGEVETLSALPVIFGSTPDGIVDTDEEVDAMFDAMVDAATGEATAGEAGVASTRTPVVAYGDTGAKVGVETLSMLPVGFGSTPGGIIETEDEADAMFDAMVDVATGEATVGDAGLVASTTPVVADDEDTRARVGVETLSTLPRSFSFGPKPGEIEIVRDDWTAAVDDAAPDHTTAGDTGAAPTKAGGGGGGEGARATTARRPSSYSERNPYPSETASAASVTTLTVDTTREVASSLAVTPSSFHPTATAAATATAIAEAEGPAPAPSVRRPPKPHHHGTTRPEKHPLASMGDLLTSCFAFVDATDGNPSLPEPLRKEMKRNAIASARSAEVSKAVKLETPPSVWVSEYEDMSKKYGLGFLLSDGGSGVTFKDGTRMALDPDGAVFEYYVEGGKHGGGGGGGSSEKSSSSPGTTEGELQQHGRRRQGRRRIERVGYALDDYPAHYRKKVTIAQKVRGLLQRAAGEQDSASGSTKALTPPAVKAILPGSSGASGYGEGRGRGGAAGAGSGGGGFGGALVKPAKAPGTGGEPLIFVEDWKRTRSSWLFRLSNRTLQVVFFDATEILLSEEARLITFVDKTGGRETMALLRALDEDRLDVIGRVRECHALIKKVIRHDERRRRD